MGLQSTITSLGALFPAACVAAGVALWCWARLSRLIAAVLAICFIAAVASAIGLKLIADAALPPLDQAGLFQLTQGAPSGHTVGATLAYGCVAVLFARLWKGGLALAGTAGCLAVIAAVCVTRVTLHTHSIADAAAGVALGLAFVALFDRAVRTQARRAEASPVGLMAVIVVIATLAVASGLRISSTHFL